MTIGAASREPRPEHAHEDAIAEAERIVADDRLRLALESGKAVGWDWDLRTNRDIWFGDLQTMFGMSGSSYVGQIEDFRRRVHPEDRGLVWKAVNDAMTSRQPYIAEFRIVWPDGTIRWVAAKGQFYYSVDGTAERMLGVAVDITERKHAEEALRENEERLRLAVDAGRIFAFSWDAASDEIVCSGTARFLGLEESIQSTPVTGRQMMARVHPDDREMLRAAVARLTPDCPRLHVTHRMVRPDGDVIWVERNSRAYFDAAGKMVRVIGMGAEITDRKLADEALSSVNRRLIEAQEAERARIARDLHDDVGQRLALLAVMVDQLESLQPDRPADVRSVMSALRKQITEISGNVQGLAHELHSSRLQHLGVVAAMKGFCKELAGQQNVEIDFRNADVPAGVSPEISLCLFRVLQEALRNAVRHSRVRQFNVQLRGTADTVQLTVSDGGHGFDVDAAAKRGGLGLTSMKERLKLVGGKLAIESHLKRGTTVLARVPLGNA